MAISVDGIISGIDTTSLIDELVAAYSGPKELLEYDIADYEALQTGLSELSSRMSDLSTSLEDIGDVDDLRQFSVSYPETDAFVASATGEAIAGVYAVEVSALANSALEVSGGFADNESTGVIAEGTLSLTYDGVTTDITVDSSNSSLNELAADIDDIDGLTSYVMNTGDATEPYRLVIQGDDTGADYGITIDTSGLVGAGTVPSFTEQTAASDAALSINGVDVVSSSNTITDSIQGLELELTGLTTDAVNVTVSLDTEAVEEKIQTFVDAYNDVVGYINDNSNAADEAEDIEAGIFNGDSSVRWIMSTLRSKISAQYTSNDLDSLSLMGISTESDGTITFDSGDFQDALQDYRSSVEEMFTASDGFGSSMIDSLDVFVDPVDGTIKQRTDSIDTLVAGLEDQIDAWEERIVRYEERLRSSFTSFESTAGELQGTALFIESYFFGTEN